MAAAGGEQQERAAGAATLSTFSPKRCQICCFFACLRKQKWSVSPRRRKQNVHTRWKSLFKVLLNIFSLLFPVKLHFKVQYYHYFSPSWALKRYLSHRRWNCTKLAGKLHGCRFFFRLQLGIHLNNVPSLHTLCKQWINSIKRYQYWRFCRISVIPLGFLLDFKVCKVCFHLERTGIKSEIRLWMSQQLGHFNVPSLFRVTAAFQTADEAWTLQPPKLLNAPSCLWNSNFGSRGLLLRCPEPAERGKAAISSRGKLLSNRLIHPDEQT